jgi:septal ring factor EnvC (AmiA/AmiB activator)
MMGTTATALEAARELIDSLNAQQDWMRSEIAGLERIAAEGDPDLVGTESRIAAVRQTVAKADCEISALQTTLEKLEAEADDA